MQLPAKSALVLYLSLVLSSYLTILLEWKCLSVTDAITYYAAVLFKAFKSFMQLPAKHTSLIFTGLAWSLPNYFTWVKVAYNDICASLFHHNNDY
jgi:hypothetical protein